jgi:hypothetical protein
MPQKGLFEAQLRQKPCFQSKQMPQKGLFEAQLRQIYKIYITFQHI